MATWLLPAFTCRPCVDLAIFSNWGLFSAMIIHFPRDAMLRPYVRLSVYVCLCLSVTSRRSVETAEQLKLDFCMAASFHPSYTLF